MTDVYLIKFPTDQWHTVWTKPADIAIIEEGHWFDSEQEGLEFIAIEAYYISPNEPLIVNITSVATNKIIIKKVYAKKD